MIVTSAQAHWRQLNKLRIFEVTAKLNYFNASGFVK
jgi:hypothetical protein